MLAYLFPTNNFPIEKKNKKQATELEDRTVGLNQMTSDPIALGTLVTDPKNEIAEATGFLLSVSRFLADTSDTRGRRRVVCDVARSHW